MKTPDIKRFQHSLEQLLKEYPQGIREHDLIRRLQQAPHAWFDANALSNSLDLFRCHFLLFHALYRLQDDWLNTQHGWLEISPLNIQRQPLTSSHPGPSHTSSSHKESAAQSPCRLDPLRDYYLDWRHLETTDADAVEALLHSFWKRFNSDETTKITTFDPTTEDALQQLELIGPVSLHEIKVQYRRLAHRHHPDKGGDEARFQRLSQAFQHLKQWY